MADASDDADLRLQASYVAALDALRLPRLSGSPDELRSATTDRRPFDIAGWELIGRAGMVCEMVVGATARQSDGSIRGLTLDEAVNGGLLVRLTKLLRALFDSTQTEDSEAHQILARCAAETAVNLRWLLTFGETEHYKRFRADAFPTLLRIVKKIDTDHADPIMRGTGERVTDFVARELRDAGLEHSDVPKQPGRWAGNLRQRFDDLDEGGLYEAFFLTHSDYVHGSWHELRTFHLRSAHDGYELDLTYGGLTPSAMYETSRLVFRTIGDYIERMPVAGLDLQSLRIVAEGTIEVANFATLEFARYVAEGGVDDLLKRHPELPTERLSRKARETQHRELRDPVVDPAQVPAKRAGSCRRGLRQQLPPCDI